MGKYKYKRKNCKSHNIMQILLAAIFNKNKTIYLTTRLSQVINKSPVVRIQKSGKKSCRCVAWGVIGAMIDRAANWVMDGGPRRAVKYHLILTVFGRANIELLHRLFRNHFAVGFVKDRKSILFLSNFLFFITDCIFDYHLSYQLFFLFG